MFTILRFSQINLLRQREKCLSSHLFLWPKVTLNCSYLLSITTRNCFQKLHGFPGIKFKEKINECLCERPFEKGNAVVVGRRGEGVCFELTFLRGRGGCTRMALSTSNLKCWKLVRYFLLNTRRTPFHVLFVWSEVTYRSLWKKALKFRQFYFKQANEYPHLRLDSLNVWKYKVRLYLDEDYFIIDLVLNPSDRSQSSPAQLRQHGLGVPPMGTMHLLFHCASTRPGE